LVPRQPGTSTWSSSPLSRSRSFNLRRKKKSDPSMVVVWDIDRKGQRVFVNVCFWIGCSFFGGYPRNRSPTLWTFVFQMGWWTSRIWVTFCRKKQ
jgi:hypothetical protein